ncbi:hypothetical protein MLD38_028598 [Melastoma candidum]|uniref:Uncharacterized protein n=1 Tax=Melastoma candidum TaxID=119954 RepID=A0ACB9N167_9MYRT|nr:hypothetical protein MLD38_028598 [Melastoma candidum]
MQNAAALEELFPSPEEEADIEARVEARIASLQEGEQRYLARLEERLNAVQGHNIYSFEDYDIQVPQISVPHKFNFPDFEKFKGIGCPKMHLKHFLHKMSIYPKDDLLQVALFQKSLTGSALHWYLSLDTSKYLSFKELAQDLLNHYSFNIEMAPTLSDLRKLEKYRNESIKDFARRTVKSYKRIADLTPIPDPLDVMYHRLHEMGYITPIPPAQVNPSSRGYNPNAVCHYHSGGIGHDTRNCVTLRFKIQSLLDNKIIAFETPINTPNIQQNPLPEHANVISNDDFGAELPPLSPAT